MSTTPDTAAAAVELRAASDTIGRAQRLLPPDFSLRAELVEIRANLLWVVTVAERESRSKGRADHA